MRYELIDINTKTTENEGDLSFFEGNKDTPFQIKRFYYIYGALMKTKRGGHAHKELKQLIFCPYGNVHILLDDTIEKKEIILDNPKSGLILYEGIWRDMIWHANNSVLCVAASDYYDEKDYIRDYEEYCNYMK